MLHHVVIRPVHLGRVGWLMRRLVPRLAILCFIGVIGPRGWGHRHAICDHVGVVHLVAVHHHARVALHVGVVRHAVGLGAHLFGHVGGWAVGVGRGRDGHFLHGCVSVLGHHCGVHVWVGGVAHRGLMVRLVSTVLCWYGRLLGLTVWRIFLSGYSRIGFIFVGLGFLAAN